VRAQPAQGNDELRVRNMFMGAAAGAGDSSTNMTWTTTSTPATYYSANTFST